MTISSRVLALLVGAMGVLAGSVGVAGTASATNQANHVPVAHAAKSCRGIHGNGLRGSIPVRAYGKVTCSTARSVMHTIYNEAGQNHKVRGWRCVGPSAGGAECRKGSARITGG